MSTLLISLINSQNLHSKAQFWLQPLWPPVYHTHEKKSTTREKWKLQKHPWWTFGRNDPWVTTTHKRSNGKKGIFLAISLANQTIGYALNKQELTDAICMGYGWKVKGIPTHCPCGETNSVDHTLICKLGGYTSNPMVLSSMQLQKVSVTVFSPASMSYLRSV